MRTLTIALLIAGASLGYLTVAQRSQPVRSVYKAVETNASKKLDCLEKVSPQLDPVSEIWVRDEKSFELSVRPRDGGTLAARPFLLVVRPPELQDGAEKIVPYVLNACEARARDGQWSTGAWVEDLEGRVLRVAPDARWEDGNHHLQIRRRYALNTPTQPQVFIEFPPLTRPIKG